MEVEVELHFLSNCPVYQDSNEYTNLLNYIVSLNPFFYELSNIEKWIYISSLEDPQLNYLFARFIVKPNETSV